MVALAIAAAWVIAVAWETETVAMSVIAAALAIAAAWETGTVVTSAIVAALVETETGSRIAAAPALAIAHQGFRTAVEAAATV